MLVEDEAYERGVAGCGGAAKVDQAIAPIIYALGKNPMGFEETDVPSVYLARTKLRINGPDVVLSHSVWFRPDPASRTVHLLWIEITDPDAMGEDCQFV